MENKKGNQGGLSYPSDNDVSICIQTFQTEKVPKSYNCQSKAIYTFFNLSKIVIHFINNLTILNSIETVVKNAIAH